MKIVSLLRLALTTSAVWATAHFASAQTIWLVDPGTVAVTPSYTQQWYDEFYAGTVLMPLPADITQRTETVRFDYGLAPRFALDLSLGYTEVKFNPPGANFTRSGRDDFHLGLTYALLEESATTPALTLRIGGILAGGYSVPTTLPPINPGDGADGIEVSLAAGKAFAEHYAVYGELGYRWRNHDVPEDIFGSAGVSARFGGWSFNVGYRHTQGLSGGDIGGTGFGTAFGFPQVKEISKFVEEGISFSDAGGRSYQLVVGESVGVVRNSGRATVVNVSISLPFHR